MSVFGWRNPQSIDSRFVASLLEAISVSPQTGGYRRSLNNYYNILVHVPKMAIVSYTSNIPEECQNDVGNSSGLHNGSCLAARSSTKFEHARVCR